MADIQYPATLPNFRMGKRRTQQQTYRTSQPFAGPLFIEKISDESPVSWEVTITCTSRLQSIQFQAFLRAVNNGQPFDKSILTEEGAILHEVRFVEMPLQPNQINDFMWEYSGLIYAVKLIQPIDVVDDLLVANWLQDGDIIDNALNNLWGA